jgi:hypothetical protein
MPLTKGRYGQQNPFLGLIGNSLTNIAQSDSPVRSNLEWAIGDLSDGALAATGVAACVPVPVDIGQLFTGLVIVTGATAGSTINHAGAGLYAGTGAAPAKIAASADLGSTNEMAANAPVYFVFATPVLITPTNAPNGFIYASVTVTSATTIPTAVSMSTPTGINAQWFTASTTPVGYSPLFLSATAGAALAGVSASTIASPAAKAVGPVVFLV